MGLSQVHRLSPETSLGRDVESRGAVWAVACSGAQCPAHVVPDPLLAPIGPGRGRGEVNMTVGQIIEGLEQSAATGEAAQVAARLVFLKWALAGSGPATAQAARDALRERAAQCPSSAAAQAFVGYLQQATRPICRPAGRRTRGARPQ